jgi:tRNA(Phe) wybutosine-synthesizing methylase Tyw3
MSELKKLTENETQMVIALVNQTTRRIENSVQRFEEKINESRNEAKEKEGQDEVVKSLGVV